MKKFLIILLTLCMAVTCFSACGKGVEDNEGELVIFAGEQWQGVDAANLNDFFAKWNTKYEKTLGFKVTINNRSMIGTDLTNTITSGQGGDLFILDRFTFPANASDGMFTDWEKFLERNELDVTKIDASSLSESIYEGKHYGMPLDIDVWGIYVNTDMIDEYNQTQTDESKKITSFDKWDDLYTAGKALVKYEDGVMVRAGYAASELSQRWYSFLASSSGTVFNDDGEVDFTNSQSMKDLLTWFRKAYKGNIDQSGLAGPQNFSIGNIAIQHGSSYTMKYLQNMEVDFNFKVYPQAKRSDSDKNSGLLGGYSFAIPAKSRKISQDVFDAKCERAWKFVKAFLSDEEMALEWMKTVGSFSPLKAAWDNDYIKNDPYLGVMKDYIDDALVRPAHTYFPIIQSSYIIEDIVKFMTGSATVDDALSSMDDKINTAIQAYKNMSGLN